MIYEHESGPNDELYVIPVKSILGKLHVVPVGDTGTILALRRCAAVVVAGPAAAAAAAAAAVIVAGPAAAAAAAATVIDSSLVSFFQVIF
jgi:hypothetical protein